MRNLLFGALLIAMLTSAISCSQDKAPVVVQEPEVPRMPFSFSEVPEVWRGEDLEWVSSTQSRLGTGRALLVRTGENPWGGAIYGASDYNVVDGETIAVNPNADYLVSVWVKGYDAFEGTPIQVHVIGNNEATLGITPEKTELIDGWQQIRLYFRTRPDTTHIGIMIVKYNDPTQAAFLIDDLELVELN